MIKLCGYLIGSQGNLTGTMLKRWMLMWFTIFLIGLLPEVTAGRRAPFTFLTSRADFLLAFTVQHGIMRTRAKAGHDILYTSSDLSRLDFLSQNPLC
jgi:hypothetical protein